MRVVCVYIDSNHNNKGKLVVVILNANNNNTIHQTYIYMTTKVGGNKYKRTLALLYELESTTLKKIRFVFEK